MNLKSWHWKRDNEKFFQSGNLKKNYQSHFKSSNFGSVLEEWGRLYQKIENIFHMASFKTLAVHIFIKINGILRNEVYIIWKYWGNSNISVISIHVLG